MTCSCGGVVRWYTFIRPRLARVVCGIIHPGVFGGRLCPRAGKSMPN